MRTRRLNAAPEIYENTAPKIYENAAFESCENGDPEILTVL